VGILVSITTVMSVVPLSIITVMIGIVAPLIAIAVLAHDAG
jgi:hypothetical protein